jgi:hypothetical protein
VVSRLLRHKRQQRLHVRARSVPNPAHRLALLFWTSDYDAYGDDYGYVESDEDCDDDEYRGHEHGDGDGGAVEPGTFAFSLSFALGWREWKSAETEGRNEN